MVLTNKIIRKDIEEGCLRSLLRLYMSICRVGAVSGVVKSPKRETEFGMPCILCQLYLY